MSPDPKTKPRLTILRDRARMLAAARLFFHERNIIEVDTPALSRTGSVDQHIDLIPCTYNQNELFFLFSSPEYGMKRLLSEGIGDCYQLSHVFRDGEQGRLHRPEFMLCEWYRCGVSYEAFIEETLDFLRLFLKDLPASTLSYREAFETYAKIDPFSASDEELLTCLDDHSIPLYSGVIEEGRDATLNLLLAHCIEPNLGQEGFTALTDYPASQAALAQVKERDYGLVAERFEIYRQGIELTNGYHELSDPLEQRQRLEAANHERVQAGKPEIPIDEAFLKALELGLPDCCGVAVGIDRLMLLRHKAEDLASVLPIDPTDYS